MNIEQEVIPITTEEEKQLRRVFDLLCHFHQKKRIEEEIDHIRRKYGLKFYSVHDFVEMRSLSTWSSLLIDAQMTTQERTQIENLFDDLQKIKSDQGIVKTISIQDVMTMLRTLRMKVPRRDVEEMVWEVDEDLDNALAWPEFRLMFTRNIMDKTGLEPARMFNLTQFLIYDDNVNGKVSLDETMHMLYTRY